MLENVQTRQYVKALLDYMMATVIVQKSLYKEGLDFHTPHEHFQIVSNRRLCLVS